MTELEQLRADIAALQRRAELLAIPIPEGFTRWFGGECPIPSSILIEIICRGDCPVTQGSSANSYFWIHDGSSADLIAYRVVEEAKPALGLWKPTPDESFWYKPNIGNPFTVRSHTDNAPYFEIANCYRTEAEAQARAELDKRLAVHAMLRQLGGGDDGSYVVLYDRALKLWMAIHSCWQTPGEARFTTQAAAQAALDYLRERGVLVDGRAL